MSNTGKTSTYIRKSSAKESTTPNTGFKKTRFLHEASEGDTLIQLSSLTTPTGVVGYSAPNVSELTQTNLMQWTQNVSLTSSLRGLLIQNLAYVISGASTIKLLFDAEDGEIFECVIDHNARTGLTMVDAAPLVVSGVLAAGDTDFNVGMPYQVGAYPSAKRGVVQVEIDGQPVYRTDGNAAFGVGIEGDYYEVHSGGGLGQLLRFQPDLSNDRFIMVTSVGALVEKPNGSIMAAVETVQGQIDAMIPTLAALAEVDETDFQAAPNNTDLKSFGDRVLQTEADIESLETTKENKNEGPGKKIGFDHTAGSAFSMTAGDLHFVKFVAATDAVITRMSAFKAAQAVGIKSVMGIYSSASGIPSTKLSQTNEHTNALGAFGSAHGGLTMYDLQAPVTLVKGTEYWLCYIQDTTANMENAFNAPTSGLFVHKAAFGYTTSLPASVSAPFTSPSGGFTSLAGW